MYYHASCTCSTIDGAAMHSLTKNLVRIYFMGFLERKYIIYSNTSWGLSRLNTTNKISTLKVPSGKLADRVGTTLP